MNNSIRARHPRRSQGGMTVVVVLILLSVMLMGGLALGRLGEVGTLVAGNVASKEASMQASQIGTMNAFQSIQSAGFDEGIDSQDAVRGTKYFAMMQAIDANGLPQVAWDGVPEVTVGRYSVRAVVDRMCNKVIITDALQDCLVREVRLDVEKANANTDPVESPMRGSSASPCASPTPGAPKPSPRRWSAASDRDTFAGRHHHEEDPLSTGHLHAGAVWPAGRRRGPGHLAGRTAAEGLGAGQAERGVRHGRLRLDGLGDAARHRLRRGLVGRRQQRLEHRDRPAAGKQCLCADGPTCSRWAPPRAGRSTRSTRGMARLLRRSTSSPGCVRTGSIRCTTTRPRATRAGPMPTWAARATVRSPTRRPSPPGRTRPRRPRRPST